ncbi:MAG: NDP-hexose 2,3-dehydratase family protein [Nonlabens sp.]
MTILEWIENYRQQIKHEIERIPFSEMKEWKFQEGNIQRDDKSFFSIKAATSDHIEMADTVIVHQPEIGILGFILCIQENELYILLHAKSEPGNINLTQIGPSVQATESNYNKKHSGRPTPFINLFTQEGDHTIFSIKQSEQGNRFFNKYNRNVAVLVDTIDVEDQDNKFKWFKLDEVVKYLNEPHLFNTDFKSVIAHLFEFLMPDESVSGDEFTKSLIDSYKNKNAGTAQALLNKIEKSRSENKFKSQLIPLNELSEWDGNSCKLLSNEAHFNFDYFEVTLYDRERIHWKQPLITKESTEKLVLIVGMHEGVLSMVFKERYEIGYTNYFQLGPTLQYDEYTTDVPIGQGRLLFSFQQSEEGGRFYKNNSIYAVCQKENLDEYVDSKVYYILNLQEVFDMLKITGVLTNESRTMIASFIPYALTDYNIKSLKAKTTQLTDI